MSVLVLDPKVYQRIYGKAHQYYFRSVCDIDYCSVFHNIYRGDDEIKRIITTWCNLNEESYNKRYKCSETEPKLSYFIDFDRYELPIINTYQMLKYLQAVKYNIEVDTIERPLTVEEAEDLKTLDKCIEEIMINIINEIPEYKQAKWSEA